MMMNMMILVLMMIMIMRNGVCLERREREWCSGDYCMRSTFWLLTNCWQREEIFHDYLSGYFFRLKIRSFSGFDQLAGKVKIFHYPCRDNFSSILRDSSFF